MPKATAVWLIENTSLTFEQIGNFCDLHVLEVKGIADGEVAQGMKGTDPVQSRQIEAEEITKGQNDPSYRLRMAIPKVKLPEVAKKGGHRYTPLSRRHDRPNAILWLLRHYPELKMAQIIRLIGTTKSSVEKIRQKAHWNMSNLAPVDPVVLGLCTQTDLNEEVAQVARLKPETQRMDGGEEELAV